LKKESLSWDEYFMQIAKIVAQKSHCYSIKIGAVLVREKTIVSTGYNGPPMGVPHCEARHPKHKKECPRRYLGFPHGEGLYTCPAGHAERNALILAARNGIATKGTILYCYCGIPCKDCAIEIINAGVKEVICLNLEEYDQRPEAMKSKYLFDEAGVKIRVFVIK